jgi:intein/homing endonuclease
MVETKMREIAKSFGWTFRATHYRGAYGSGKNNIINSKDLRDFLDAKFGHGSFEKYIHADVFHAPVEFISGLIGGYFDGDGNISVERQHIRVSSRNETLLRDINRLLGYCGLYGYLGKETSIRMPDAVQYTLNIPKSLIKDFQETIGLQLPEKAEALNTIANYKVSLQNPTRSQDMIDKIPALGEIIAETGKLLALPGQSRNYGRWAKKESIGRETLISYLPIFKAAAETETNPEIVAKVNANIYLLESAAYSDVLWDEIVELKYHEDPHTFVYDFTVPGNDSFMVDDNILVHNTLNSVDWDTEIMIAKDGKFYAPKIGEFIDNYIQTCNQTKIQYLPNDQIYVPLEDGHEWSAVSTDEYGQMMWTKLEAITKHPVVNEDGTDTILEVMTESGRVVRATKGKSFLTLRDGKFLPLNGSDLKIGDELPVANTLAIHQLSTIKTLDVSTILSPMEYLYGTEAQKALNAMKNADEMGQRHWFSEANGREFMVPYSRSDAFRDAFANGKNTRAETFLPGFVYPKSTRSCSSQIPSTIELTKEFGFFVGAYLSEGSSSTTQIQITNNDKVFLAPIRTLLDSWSIGHHTTSVGKVIENTGIKGRTTSLIIHSTLLTALMRKTFGHISYEKTIPDWVYQAPNEFVLALLDGYFSGDGSVALDGSITCSSVSEALIIKLSALLTRYSIFGTMSSYMPKLGKFKSVSRQYAFRIPQMYAAIFAKIISLTIMKKQERLNKLLEKEHNVCKYKTFNDVVLDKVKSIVPIHPKGGKVYDVTVKHTRNFTSLNQVCHRDTFHLSGVSSKSAMTRGVPRLKELLKVTRNPKAVELTIPLRHDLRGKKEEARRVSKELEFTLLQDIVTIARIYFDPKDTATLIGEDQDWLAYLAAYEKLSTGGLLPVVAHDPLKATQTTEAQQPKPTLQESEEKSPWILRFELDREKMFNKNITMDDIAMILRKKFSSDITSLYTDYNAPRLVFRIRLNASAGAIDDLNTLKTLQNKVLSCTAIRGIPGLRVVNYQKVEDTVELRDGKYVPAEQYILISDGSNFLDVITHPDVDPNRIVSSNVHDMFANLGIEATRATLCKEITTLFADAGSSVNYRHVCILLDKMCHKGRTMSIDRYGINKNDIGPLAKMSFEQTEDIALRAAIFGERDPVLGISSKVMLGAPIKAGTAFSEIMLDEAMTIQFNENAPEQHPPENIPFGSNVPSFSNEEIQDALYGGAEDDSECSPANLHIPIMLPPTNQLHKQMPMDTITETDDENSGVVIYE